MPSAAKSSHAQILKSSALIGGSSAINLLVSMIRVKFTAICLGTFGVGLFGAYMTILGPLATLCGLGLATSGVRQIAEAAGKGDEEKIGRSLLTVRRASKITGLGGMLLLLAASYPLSMATFGNAKHVLPLCVLSVTLLIGNVTGGLEAIILGLRRIRDKAAQTILGAVLGLPIVIPLLLLCGVNAVVPIVITSSVVAMVVAWWFARRAAVAPVKMTWWDTWHEAKPLLQLGAVLMFSDLITAVAAYLQRVLIIRNLGLEANGIYSAAWNLSNYYVGFILGAMGADFYPRLTAANENNAEVNRLVNEQTEVGLLLAVPGILATMLLAPLVIRVFYTSDFLPAVEVLRWQTLGLMLRLVSWPMGFIMLAQGAKRWYFWTEFSTNIASVALIWGGIRFCGLKGTGIAFFALSLFHTGLMLLVSRRLSGFSWSAANLRLLAATAGLLTIATVASFQLPLLWNMSLGAVLFLAASWHTVTTLTKLTGQNPIIAGWEKLANLFPFKMKPSDPPA